MSEMLQHLVLVRHGEGEGDVRRAAWRRGESIASPKRPEDEALTTRGIEQSKQAGEWINKHVLGKLALKSFDSYFVSMSLRSLQSAVAMEFGDATWLGDNRLNERSRGLIRGLKPERHRQLYPENYENMRLDPLHWVPPGGESIVDVSERWRSFYDDICDSSVSTIIVGHRDQMWAAMRPLELLDDDEFLAVDTDEISNAFITHYTSVDPISGNQAPALAWKRSVDPTNPSTDSGWQVLPHVAAKYGI